MNKNTVFGLLFVGVILFGYTWYNSHQSAKFEEARQTQLREKFVADSLDRINNPHLYATDTIPDAVASAPDSLTLAAQAAGDRDARVAYYGEALVGAAENKGGMIAIENDLIKVYLSSRGAKVTNVQLKDYERYGGGDLMLFKEGSAGFDFEFFVQHAGREIRLNSGDYTFKVGQPVVEKSDDGVPQSCSLTMSLPVADGASIDYIYTLRAGQYMVDFDIRFVGLENRGDIVFDWKATTLQNEKGFKNENNYTTIAYRYPEASSIEQLAASEGARSTEVTTKVNWLSFKQQFFSSVIIAEDAFTGGEFGFDTHTPESGEIKDFKASLNVPYSPEVSDYKFKFYFGPNKYSILKSYDLQLEQIIPLGGKLISWINTGFVIKIFDWLSRYISSYGIIILILTLLIKLIILPLTYKSYMSTAKMRVLKPEIDEIGERYPDKADALKKQQATMQLYKRSGVSPMGGCLPTLIQMPIIFALFRFFPASIELRGQSFLWAEDLSAYDSVLNLPFNIPFYGNHVSLFTLLMAVALFFYSKLNYKQTASSAPQMGGMKFMTVYLMPVLMLCWFNSYASGLTYYYMLSQFITIAIMIGFRYFVNEDKLHAKLKSNAARADAAGPKKKGKFQARYEEALRAQQEMQRQRQQGGSAKTHTAKPQSTKNQPPKKRK